VCPFVFSQTFSAVLSLVNVHLLLVAGSLSQHNRSPAEWQRLHCNVSDRNDADDAADVDDDDDYERSSAGRSQARCLLHFILLVSHFDHLFIKSFVFRSL